MIPAHNQDETRNWRTWITLHTLKLEKKPLCSYKPTFKTIYCFDRSDNRAQYDYNDLAAIGQHSPSQTGGLHAYPQLLLSRHGDLDKLMQVYIGFSRRSDEGDGESEVSGDQSSVGHYPH